MKAKESALRNASSLNPVLEAGEQADVYAHYIMVCRRSRVQRLYLSIKGEGNMRLSKF